MMRPVRLRCHLLGCREHEDYPACSRRIAHRYDPEFIERGWLDPLFDFAALCRHRVSEWWHGKRCYHCRSRIVRPHGSDDGFCSQACDDNFIPF